VSIECGDVFLIENKRTTSA